MTGPAGGESLQTPSSHDEELLLVDGRGPTLSDLRSHCGTEVSRAPVALRQNLS